MVCDQNVATKSFKLCHCVCRWRCKCLIERKKKSHPPFNSGVPIEVKQGMHPKLSMNSTEAPPPGTYDTNLNFEKNKCRYVTNWEREEAVKEFASTMGGKLIDKYIVQRELMKFGLGPGTHELKQWPENFLEKNCAAQARDTGFGIGPRFKRSYTKSTPGPGYNGKDHNPYYHIERNRFKSHSHLPTFEFDGLQPRFQNRSKTCSIPCNRYNSQHPECLEKILKKVTGRRGPYDLFTGPRNETTLIGYQSVPKSIDSKNWPMKYPTEYEKGFGGSNRYKGLWSNCPRFAKKPTVRSMLEDISLCYKDPDLPGPGFYHPSSPGRSLTQGIHPFNDSVRNARPLRPSDISPGPGTYDVNRGVKRIPGNGWTSTFRSKVQRSIGPKVDQHNSF